jgi:hypothetical protein
MLSAYFEDEPDAEAAAGVLQDLSYAIAKFYRGEIGDNENNAVLLSDEAPYDSFTTVVTRHGGRVVEEA